MCNQQIICKNIERILNSYIITAIAAVKNISSYNSWLSSVSFVDFLTGFTISSGLGFRLPAIIWMALFSNSSVLFSEGGLMALLTIALATTSVGVEIAVGKK